MFLTDLSLKRPVLATVSILALVVLGITSYFGLNINDWPEVEFPFVTVTVVQPGASPEQMETKVSLKVEEAMAQISGVKHLYTTVQEGASTTIAEFTLETSPDTAAQDVRDKLGSIRGNLPQDIEEPIIARYDPAAAPIMSLAVTGDISVRELSLLVDDQIKKRLEAITGVGAVGAFGDQRREIQLNLDRDKLAALSLTTFEVIQSLQAENMDVPGGKVTGDQRQVSIRTSGKVTSLDDFLKLPVVKRGGVPIYLGDIATVTDGIKEPDSLGRYQGKPAIGLNIIKQSGANAVRVADSVKAEVAAIKENLPPGVELEIVRDNSIEIRNSVEDVLRTLIEGSILAVLTVLLFLRDWRSTLISAIAIPTSIITTFFAMRTLGYTLNTMTLMALSLSVGLLIDDAIVVIENTVRHLHMGKSPYEAAKQGMAEIGMAVTATTFTVVAVFLPVGMMTGVVGQFFKQFGITVVCSVLVSLLISFTLVPLFSSRYLKAEDEITRPKGFLGKLAFGFNQWFDTVAHRYAEFLKTVLKARWRTLGAAVLLLVASLMMTSLLGSEFVPIGDLNEFTVVAELDAGLNLEGAGHFAGTMEKALVGIPEITKVYATARPEQVKLFIRLQEKSQRSRSISDIMAQARNQLVEIPGASISMIRKGPMSEEKTVQYRLMGNDITGMQVSADQLRRIMETIPGVYDISSSYKPGKPEVLMTVRQQSAADLGISTGQIAQTLRTLYNGVVVSKYEDGDKQIDVRVQMDPSQRRSLDDLTNLYVMGSNEDRVGNKPMVPLTQVTEKSLATSPAEIHRFDRTREIYISCNLDGVSLGKFNEALDAKLKAEGGLAGGGSIYLGGDSSMMGETFTNMTLALLLGVLFILFILAAQFESYIDPFAIILSLPLAVVGAILGLFIANSAISLVSMIGIIMLMGLVTKNAILLIDFTKNKRKEGMNREEALYAAAKTRLRPIIMTSTAMIFGMIPLALGLGTGAEQRAPMAHAIIGGLITSTLLTLVVVPVIYTLLDDLKSWMQGVRNKQKSA